MRPSPRTLVGVLHREGWGVERDYAEAVKCFALLLNRAMLRLNTIWDGCRGDRNKRVRGHG
jgi:hypothetical protein